jgi:hypothetical protein
VLAALLFWFVLGAAFCCVLPAMLPAGFCAVDCPVCPVPTVFAGVSLVTGGVTAFGVVVLVVLELWPLTVPLVSGVVAVAGA